MPKAQEIVNNDPRFADLRRVYASRIVAQWIRERDQIKPGAYHGIVNSGNLSRWPARTPWDPQKVYADYLKSQASTDTWMGGGPLVQSQPGPPPSSSPSTSPSGTPSHSPTSAPSTTHSPSATEPTSASPTGNLAHTGSPVTPYGIAAIAALASGSALVFWRRYRIGTGTGRRE